MPKRPNRSLRLLVGLLVCAAATSQSATAADEAKKKLPPQEGRSPQGMYPHFVIPDVKGMMERLRQTGYRIIAEAKDYDYGTEGFVADPDGFVWALISQ